MSDASDASDAVLVREGSRCCCVCVYCIPRLVAADAATHSQHLTSQEPVQQANRKFALWKRAGAGVSLELYTCAARGAVWRMRCTRARACLQVYRAFVSCRGADTNPSLDLKLGSVSHPTPYSCPLRRTLLLAGIATSTHCSGESESQNAITGRFTYDASLTACGGGYRCGRRLCGRAGGSVHLRKWRVFG